MRDSPPRRSSVRSADLITRKYLYAGLHTRWSSTIDDKVWRNLPELCISVAFGVLGASCFSLCFSEKHARVSHSASLSELCCNISVCTNRWVGYIRAGAECSTRPFHRCSSFSETTPLVPCRVRGRVPTTLFRCAAILFFFFAGFSVLF